MTKIEWAERTWNVTLGCAKVSPGCDHCYAVNNTWRMAHNPNPRVGLIHEGIVEKVQQFQPTVEPPHLEWTGKIVLVNRRLEDPEHWKRPSRIFVCSLSDLFHQDVPFTFLDRVFEVIANCNHHRFLILTKRPLRMRAYIEEHLKEWRIPEDEVISRYLAHIWFGVTAEDQERANARIPILMSMPALHRWVSAEPLLGPLDLSEWLYPGGLEWVVAGGESGKDARPDKEAWYFSLIRQCYAGFGRPATPLFIKQCWNREQQRLVKMPDFNQRVWAEYPPELVSK